MRKFILFALALGAAWGCNASLETTCVGGDSALCQPLAPITAASSSSGAGGSDNCFKTCSPPGPTMQTGQFPCDVEAVLSTICRNCHTDPPQNGAPFPLIDYAKSQQPPQGGYPDAVLFQLMRDALLGVKAGITPMPLAPFNTKITDDQKAAIESWSCNCAPPRPSGQKCM